MSSYYDCGEQLWSSVRFAGFLKRSFLFDFMTVIKMFANKGLIFFLLLIFPNMLKIAHVLEHFRTNEPCFVLWYYNICCIKLLSVCWTIVLHRLLKVIKSSCLSYFFTVKDFLIALFIFDLFTFINTFQLEKGQEVR